MFSCSSSFPRTSIGIASARSRLGLVWSVQTSISWICRPWSPGLSFTSPTQPIISHLKKLTPDLYLKGWFKQSMQSPWFSPRWLPAGSVEGTFKRRRGSCARPQETSLLVVHLLLPDQPSSATCQARVPKHSKQSPGEKTKQIIWFEIEHRLKLEAAES